MAINNNLVQFGYGKSTNAPVTAGYITFASDTRQLFVGDGSTAVAFAGNVANAVFADKKLTITYNNGAEAAVLDFSDVASAGTVSSLLSSLRDSINTKVETETYNSKMSAVDASLGAHQTAINNLVDADTSLADRITALENDTTVDTKVAKVTAATTDNVVIFAAGGEVKDSGIKVGTDTLTDTAVADASTLATEKAVRDAIDAVSTNAAVSVTADGTNLVYTITQGGTQVGTINIPKDMVVESGTVVTNPEGQPEGTYIKLVLKNVPNPLYINVSTLIEYVTSGSTASDMVVINVSDDHKVTATITDGTVTKAKLSSDVQASLGKADTAIQSVTTGTTNGTIKVGDTDVAVAGLGTAAYKADTYFATPGDVGAAESRAKEYADIIKVNGKSQVSQAITIGGADISVGGASETYKNQDVAAAIADLDSRVKTATDNAGVISVAVDAEDASYLSVNNSGKGAVTFTVKTVNVENATEANTGLADAYEVKQYVDKTKLAIEGTEADSSAAATIAGAKAYADSQIEANALKWNTLS